MYAYRTNLGRTLQVSSGAQQSGYKNHACGHSVVHLPARAGDALGNLHVTLRLGARHSTSVHPKRNITCKRHGPKSGM